MNQSSKPEDRRENTVAAPSNTPAPAMDGTPEVQGSGQPGSENRAPGSNDRRAVVGICIFLAAIVWVVFGQTRHFGFINYDDDSYVYENPTVIQGLNLKGIEWAFTHIIAFNWHPLTIMSHMLDCSLYGLNAGGHHLTNVLLHTGSVILLFLGLRQMTGKLWRSALVAAVFAIHPLRVESVAWVAERKDVLSGLFFMLTLLAYVRYVRRPFSLGRYLLVVFLFALGLLSKPMLVTLPFVLLLLDFWPLNRFAPPAPALAVAGNGDSSKSQAVHWGPILEKTPLLALSGAVCVVTMMAQKSAIGPVPASLRFGNAVVSYIVYLRQMFCPTDLAILYRYPRSGLPFWEIMLALLLLAAVSAGAFLWRQKHPYLLMGWLWYLGMLIPVIGLVQVGGQAHADRYTYLPQIGLYLALIWSAGSLGAGWRYRSWIFSGVSAAILVALIFCARIQTSYWRNGELLWGHTVACTSGNYIAYNNLGNILVKDRRVNEAIAQYQAALQIRPDYAVALDNLGNALLQQGKVDEAIDQLQTALQIQPANAKAHNNLGNALLQKERVDEAIGHYQTALQIEPGYAEAHNNLGNALFQKGRVDEAIAQFQTAMQIKPDYAEAHNNLAWVLATSSQASLRNGSRAVELARQANQLTGGENPFILRTLAAAYAEAGQWDDARQSAQSALKLAQAAGQNELAGQINGELKLYAAGLPYHEKGK